MTDPLAQNAQSAGVDHVSAPDLTSWRYRRAAYGALANVAARCAGILLMVLTVHWAAPYLGPERFGLWATFASFAAMLSFLDLGVGNALINRVATVRAREDAQALRIAVTAGVGWLLLIGVAAAAVLATLSAMMPWSTLFKLSGASVAAEAGRTAMTFSVCFGISLFSSGLLKMLIGQQRAHEAHAVSAAGTLCACLLVWVSSQREAQVDVLLAAGFGTQAVAGLAAMAFLQRRHLFGAPMLRSMLEERSALLPSGGLFFLLQIGVMVGWGCDSFLLASINGAASVAAFAVALRLFMFATQPAAVLNGSLWPAYADAHAREDHRFIRKTLRLSALVSIGGSGLLIVLLLLLSPWLIPIWTSGSVEVPRSLLVLLAIWSAIEVAGKVFGIYLNGTNVVFPQVVVVLVFCVVALPAKAIAASIAGAQGMVMASIASYLLVHVGLFATIFRAQILGPLNLARP